MFKSSLFVGVVLGILVQVFADNFCPETLVREPKLPYSVDADNSRYQAVIERSNYGITEELVEYFDGKNNKAVVINTTPFSKTYFYSDYNTNQLLMIQNGICEVKVLNESIDLTPFYVAIVNGKEHIVSPLTHILDASGLTYSYIGTDQIRGISVRNWQVCVDSKKNETLRITLSFSDPNNWINAYFKETNGTVPVRVKIDTRPKNSVDYKSDYYEITRFFPGILVRESDFMQPPGVHCPGRANPKQLPKMPNQFSFVTQQIIPNPFNLSDSHDGFVNVVYQEYNYNRGLFTYSAVVKSTMVNVIHDYNTGLAFTLDTIYGTCKINKLTITDNNTEEEEGAIKLKGPQNFFQFDQLDYQFIGQKEVGSMMTDVWIGPKSFKTPTGTLESTQEWYILSESWNRSDLYKDITRPPIPVQLLIYYNVKSQNTSEPKWQKVQTFFDFRALEEYESNHDISNCNDQLKRRHFYFTIPNQDYTNGGSLKEDVEYFKYGAVVALSKIAGVVEMRISTIEVAFGPDDAFVLFSIYDHFPFYGDVKLPKNVALDEAYKNLNDQFSTLQVQIPYTVSGVVRTVYAEQNKLVEISDPKEGYQEIQKIINRGYSGASVAFAVIVMCVIGLLIGIMLIILHKNNKIKLPLVDYFAK